MGKGDQRSRRGKIWRGTFGRRRPRKSKAGAAMAAPAATDKKTTKKESGTAE